MKTPIMVRRYPPPGDGPLIVLFPTLPWGKSPNTCVCYMDGDVEEHDPFEILNRTAQAREGEPDVDELLRMLRSDAEANGEALYIYKRFDRRWRELRKEKIEAMKAPAGVPTCRVCGCWEQRACPGGCHWVEPNLCSRCAAKQPKREVKGAGELSQPIGHCLCCGCPIWDPEALTDHYGIGATCWKRLEAAKLEAGNDDVYDLPFNQETRDLELRLVDGHHHFNFAQAITRHSPTGMRWGYPGSGPSDCALNALLAYSADRDLAHRYHQDFKRDFIAGLPEEGGIIRGTAIYAWLLNQAPRLAL